MSVPVTIAKTGIVSKPLIKEQFDYVYFFVATWFIGGISLDSWAHANIPSLETFFTPWHGVLYSGTMAVLVALLGAAWLNRRRGASGFQAIPEGYGIALVGAIGMGITGVTDMTWHLLFGIEQNLDALFSPTHLLGIVSATLIALGPFYAMYRRPDPATWNGKLRLIYAFLLLYVILAIMGEGGSFLITYNGPLTSYPGQDNAQLLGVFLEVFQAIFVSAFALYILRRWRLPFGMFTSSLLVAGLLLFAFRHFALAPLIAVLAGLLIDTMYLWLKPTVEKTLALRLFAAIAAAAQPFFYILLLQLTHAPLAWTINMAAGSIFVTALFGWLLSYLVVPQEA